ncbi:MAG TPA: acireductone synthase [Crocinitomicaceae bacterium]|nr:acireductone synthase [Flavobacteriales bacterium]HBW86238.1 acireductone synthase [Crocinitomicaceae bacterium]
MSFRCQFVLSDIEGTTSSVSYVYDILFPYFRNHIGEITQFAHLSEVKESFAQVINLCQQEEGVVLTTSEEVIQKLLQWSREDRKITPLKTLQGIIWDKGYQLGELKGHVYDDVAFNLEKWVLNGLNVGIYSSGSVNAQKLIFKYSVAGDLTKWFSHYFDTNIGQKRSEESYLKIASRIGLDPRDIVFLSDIQEEIDAASAAGLKTIHVLREPEMSSNSIYRAKDFNEVNYLLHQI